MRLVTIIAAAVVASYLVPGVQIAATFDPTKLRLVHRVPNKSILVRGNAPLNPSGRFDPSLVLDAVRLRLLPEVDLDGHRIVVVSLVSEVRSDEKRLLDAERGFAWGVASERRGRDAADAAGDVPPAGEVMHRPLVGSYTAPPPFPALPVWNRWVWNWLRPDDGAWDLAEELHRLLLGWNGDGATLVYVHCMRGIDRTGLVTGTYMARFLNSTAEEVDRENWDVAGRELNWPARNALRWTIWRSGVRDFM